MQIRFNFIKLLDAWKDAGSGLAFMDDHKARSESIAPNVTYSLQEVNVSGTSVALHGIAMAVPSIAGTAI